MRELLIGAMAFPFRNVARYRDRCPAHLRTQPIKLVPRETDRASVDLGSKLHCLLPSSQVSKRRQRHTDLQISFYRFPGKLYVISNQNGSSAATRFSERPRTNDQRRTTDAALSNHQFAATLLFKRHRLIQCDDRAFGLLVRRGLGRDPLHPQSGSSHQRKQRTTVLGGKTNDFV
jgi:hypothetical protein